VQDDDYVVYRSSAERLLAHKKKILLAEPKDVKEYGISQQTLSIFSVSCAGEK
jgi:hypothetical protein